MQEVLSTPLNVELEIVGAVVLSATISVREEQPEKTSSLIVFTLAGRMSEVRLLQFLKDS